eukprot:6048461-Pleurochrysis_carterae.AAC.1
MSRHGQTLGLSQGALRPPAYSRRLKHSHRGGASLRRRHQLSRRAVEQTRALTPASCCAKARVALCAQRL